MFQGSRNISCDVMHIIMRDPAMDMSPIEEILSIVSLGNTIASDKVFDKTSSWISWINCKMWLNLHPQPRCIACNNGSKVK